jgi:hypothetical protein
MSQIIPIIFQAEAFPQLGREHRGRLQGHAERRGLGDRSQRLALGR